ncbi:mannitol-1-phosphate 5-dehydrogenase [Alkalihalobacillus xiaoxiensis]|uniref:Mannitol-1-phosphate 5-dehydrogenase n=1 Tax=Shouchella xiaoxiensis TaxID=766895 RepID=A0ABS2SS38_9BACI|nr:mannitol-1-phosphate 5-dehydrogenase [Shouchella xiaoxiensis]MBM7838311.1 mannitol-1-phosphate 5-dehydrogenase [Shouchella xiaoxiensis]
MRAVHFGAGNIGRGFIGAVLSEAGYDVLFSDVNEAVIQALNDRREYTVTTAAEEKQQFTVTNVSGVNSQTNETKLIEAIAEADVITTAVGPTILPLIAKTIAKGLSARSSDTFVNVIACENAIRATSQLKKLIFEQLSAEEQTKVETITGFADAAVDRIVPNVQSDDVLAVTVEPFFEWVVEQPSLKGTNVSLGQAKLVEDLNPFIERKLFTVNTGHAVAAYAGFQAGKKTIKESLRDSYIKHRVRGALNETKTILVDVYGFDADEHEAYIDKIISRFENPYLEDLVERVGRGPIRKLGAQDRLVKPAKQLAEKGFHPEALIESIYDALHFYVEGDQESETLKQLIEEHGIIGAFQEVSGVEGDHPLIKMLEKRL